MTTTDTTSDLYTVRLNDNYLQSGGAPVVFRGRDVSDITEDERTFFGCTNSDNDLILIVPESDPRHAGMWMDPTGRPNDGQQYYGWNISGQVNYVRKEPETTPATADFDSIQLGDWITWGNAEIPYYHVSHKDSSEIRLDRVSSLPTSDQSGRTHGPTEHSREVVNQYWAPITRVRFDSPSDVATQAPAGSTPEDFQDSVPPLSDQSLGGTSDLGTMLQEARQEGRDAATAEFARWKEQATETAHQYANDNSLCGEFDRCMEEIGLPSRERDYCVTFTINVSVTARDEDAAIDLAREDMSYGSESVDVTEV